MLEFFNLFFFRRQNNCFCCCAFFRKSELNVSFSAMHFDIKLSRSRNTAKKCIHSYLPNFMLKIAPNCTKNAQQLLFTICVPVFRSIGVL